jgi:hypothetical protein
MITATNDDWKSDPTSAAQLTANGLGLPAPERIRDFRHPASERFTAILAGKNGVAGTGVVELLQRSIESKG